MCMFYGVAISIAIIFIHNWHIRWQRGVFDLLADKWATYGGLTPFSSRMDGSRNRRINFYKAIYNGYFAFIYFAWKWIYITIVKGGNGYIHIHNVNDWM